MRGNWVCHKPIHCCIVFSTAPCSEQVTLDICRDVICSQDSACVGCGFHVSCSTGETLHTHAHWSVWQSCEDACMGSCVLPSLQLAAENMPPSWHHLPHLQAPVTHTGGFPSFLVKREEGGGCALVFPSPLEAQGAPSCPVLSFFSYQLTPPCRTLASFAPALTPSLVGPASAEGDSGTICRKDGHVPSCWLLAAEQQHWRRSHWEQRSALGTQPHPNHTSLHFFFPRQAFSG